VTQEIAQGVQRNPVLDEIGSEVMAQIVPAKVGDPGTLEQLSPGALDPVATSKTRAPVPDCWRHCRSVLTASSFSGT